jgi:hypothetical protein
MGSTTGPGSDGILHGNGYRWGIILRQVGVVGGLVKRDVGLGGEDAEMGGSCLALSVALSPEAPASREST